MRASETSNLVQKLARLRASVTPTVVFARIALSDPSTYAGGIALVDEFYADSESLAVLARKSRTSSGRAIAEESQSCYARVYACVHPLIGKTRSG